MFRLVGRPVGARSRVTQSGQYDELTWAGSRLRLTYPPVGRTPFQTRIRLSQDLGDKTCSGFAGEPFPAATFAASS
jgi:hypothetical protein